MCIAIVYSLLIFLELLLASALIPPLQLPPHRGGKFYLLDLGRKWSRSSRAAAETEVASDAGEGSADGFISPALCWKEKKRKIFSCNL